MFNYLILRYTYFIIMNGKWEAGNYNSGKQYDLINFDNCRYNRVQQNGFN